MSTGDMQSKRASAEYLRGVQYADGTKLGDRIALHRRFSKNPTGWHRWHYDLIAPTSSERVLEVGCGSGTLWTTNAARLPHALALLLTDFSHGMLDGARAALTAAGIHAEFAVQDAQALGLPDGAFDVVVAAHMLYHVPDRAQAIREMRRVLRSGGRAVIATNGHVHLTELDTLIARHLTGVSSAAMPFSLENGEAQLAEVFHHVERHDFSDGLRVTAAPPLVRYVLSMPGGEELTPEEVQRLSADAEALVAGPAGFEVTKSSGVFICRP